MNTFKHRQPFVEIVCDLLYQRQQWDTHTNNSPPIEKGCNIGPITTHLLQNILLTYGEDVLNDALNIVHQCSLSDLKLYKY